MPQTADPTGGAGREPGAEPPSGAPCAIPSTRPAESGRWRYAEAKATGRSIASKQPGGAGSTYPPVDAPAALAAVFAITGSEMTSFTASAPIHHGRSLGGSSRSAT